MVQEFCPSRPSRFAWRNISSLSRPVADGCAAAVKSGALWLVGGDAGVSVLEPRSNTWEEGVVDMPEPVEVVGSVEAGLASLQGGAPQPWWEQEEDPLPRVEAWTRPSRTGLRRKRDAQGLYQYGVQDQGGSRKDNFGKGWGQDPGLGPPETRYVEVPGYPGEVGRVEQAIRGGRISYPAMPISETENVSDGPWFPGYPTDPLAGLARGYPKDRGGSARDGYGWWTTPPPAGVGGWQGITRPPMVGKDSLTGLGLSTGSIGISPEHMNNHRPTRPSRGPNRGPNRGPDRAPNRGPNRPNLGRHPYPDQPEKPIGQGCVATSLAGEEGIFVAGGYMGGGRRVRWLPVSRPGRSVGENLAVLSESRRWGPAVGVVGQSLAVAGGGDWGTNTVEFFSRVERMWRRGPNLSVAREFAAGVTVDSSWFPHCNFTQFAN